MLFLRKQANESTLETILLGNGLAAIIGLPFMFGSSPTPLDWSILFFLGVFQLGLPFILYTKAIQVLSAIETILVQSLEPVLNPIWVYLAVGEMPSPQALLGGLIVLISITARAIVTALSGRRPEESHPYRRPRAISGIESQRYNMPGPWRAEARLLTKAGLLVPHG